MGVSEAWERVAEQWVQWVRASDHDSYWRFHRDAFLPLVPRPGRLTIDVGCGEGRVSRDLQALGHRMIAFDASPTMLAAAREADPDGDYRRADAAALPLDDGVADLAVAFMSLQDVDDMAGAVGEIARVLEPGGRFCLAVVHPINSVGSFDGDEDDAVFHIRDSYFESRAYVEPLELDGLSMVFHSYHHSLSSYLAPLERNGLLVEAVREPPTPPGVMRTERWTRLPLFLHVRAVKP
jgi:ubiquinone/menaquinone biosynthesis C-methylase UbiE